MQRFVMSDEDLTRLKAAAQPIPYLVAGGMEPTSPRERVNGIWREMGDRMGFEWDSAEPIEGEEEHAFRAVPKQA